MFKITARVSHLGLILKLCFFSNLCTTGLHEYPHLSSKIQVIPYTKVRPPSCILEQRKPPLQQRFWRNIAYLLHAVAVFDVKWWGLPPAPFFAIPLRFIATYCSLLYTLLLCAYVYVNFKEISLGQVEDCLFYILLGFMVMVKIAFSKRAEFKKAMIYYMENIHLYHWQKNSFVKKRLISVETYIRWMSLCLGALIFIDFFLLNYIPLHYNVYNRIKHPELFKNGTFKLMSSLYLLTPFDYDYDYRAWTAMHFINHFSSGIGSLLFLAYDAVNYAMVFHLIGHIAVLKNDLMIFVVDFKEMSEEDVRRRLIELVVYHSFVVKSFKILEAAWGMNVTFNYAFNLIVDSFIFLIIMTRGKLYGFIFSIVFFVLMGGCILMSFILEEVRRQSEGLADAVYHLPWENMSIRNQKMIILMLARVQPTLTFISAGGIRTGVQPMIGIIKSTFSYYVILKSTI